MTQQSFLNQVKEGAIQGWHKYKVLPSITAAQACLESGWGQSGLAKSPNYNLFGIKSSADWNGPSVNYKTQEWSASKGYYYVYADFRVYSSWNESIEQHGAFFTNTEWRKNNYRKVIGERNYKTAAQELKNAGYATDPGYPPKLINIIEQYNLQEWDREAFAGGNGGSSADTPISTITAEPRIVGGSITTQATNDTSKRSITVIGDSLGVGTEPYLKNYTWKSANYNNYGSRQWTHSQAVYDGLVQLQSFINTGTLNDYVVMILGTNRGVNSSEIQRAVNMIGSNRKLLLVDTDSQVGHKDSVASAYMLASETYANVFYVNWSHTALSSYYGSDKIHMTSAGYKAHAEFIVQAVYEVANTNWSNEPSKIVTESNKVVTDIKNINYQDDIFVSPNGESIIYNKSLNDQFGFRPKSGQVLWIERILKVNSDNEKEMLEEGLAYMREHSQPATQYTVSLKELPDTVSIGDVGIFVDHEFNPPLAIEARVLNITTSQSNPNNNTVTIGNVKELYPQSKDDIIAIQKQLQETREDLLDEFYKGEPLDIVIEGTSGLILSGERSKFRTELIIGPTTNLGFTGKGSHTIELYGAQKTDNEFRFSGKITNALIFEEVDEAFKYIVENTESDAVIDDPSQNPQGIDIPNPLQPVDMKTLDIQDFTVEFLDALGQVVLTDTIPIYDDGQFNYPIVGFDKNIRKIRILHDKDMDFATISFTEREANRATIDSTQLVARVYQGNREVTERFDNFSWVRVSEDSREDEGWNDKNKFIQSNHITVYADDIEDNESTFVVRLFDNDFERIVVSSSAVVKVNVEGKSAYELAVEAGFEGTLDEWVASLRGADGTNGVEGPKGDDGQSTYIHVAWADSPMGDGFSTSDSTDKEYMGTYVDEIEADSDNYLDYKWMKVKGEKGEPGEQGPRGLTGAQGPQGDQGIKGADGTDGLSSYTHIAYADTITGSGFSHSDASKPFIGIYTDSKPTSSGTASKYTWSKWHGEDGSDGVQGPKGDDGLPSYTHFAYANNATGTSGFSTTDSLNKSYLGIYTDNIKADSEDPAKYTWTLIKGATGARGPQGIQGLQGEKGDQGIKGNTGADGKSSYTHIAYATGSQGENFNHSTFDEATYVGMYVSDTQNSSANWADYEWTLIRGRDGSQGIQGPKGTDGKTPYFHVAYANNETGTLGFSINDSTNKLYIGTYTDFKPDDSLDPSKYSWTLVKGDKGDKGDTGKDGIPGKDGVGIKSTTITYGMSANETTQPVTYTDAVPTLVKGQYLWTKTVWVYTDSTTETGYTKTYIAKDGNSGTNGLPGKDGVGIKSTVITYATSSSGTIKPTSGWNSTVPTVSPGNYLWTRTVWTYTDNDTEEGYSVSRIGENGAKGDKGDKGDTGATGPQGATGSQGPRGATGTSVESITEYYLATSVSSGILSTNAGFTTTIQPLTATNKYLWNYEKINFSDNTSQPTIPVIIGVYGDKGQTGSTGATGRSITGITEHYLATSASSGVTRSTSGWSTTMQPTTETNKYLWNYETITWSSGTTTTYVEPIIIGVHGAKGPQGPQGPQGIQGPSGSNGQSQWVHVRYSANSNGSGMTTTPSSTTKYVGIAVTNSATAPAYTGFNWSKYVGENGSTGARGPQGLPGTNGTNGQTTYTWVRYADTPTSGMNQYPDGKKYIGLAFNKITPTESNNYSDYQWSLMPQNINIGGRNLLKNSGKEVSNGDYNIARYDLTDTIKENEEVTLTIWGSLATTKTNFRAYNSGGSISVATLTDNGDGTYSSTFKWKIGGSTNTYLNVYAFTNAQTGTSTINKIKLEKGNVTTDWTEAPEDTQDKIDDKANSSDLTSTIQTITEESEKIASLRTDVDITKNNFLITHTDEYVNKITTTESSVDGLDKRVVSVEETKENIDTFFQFDDAFTIGKSNAQTKLRLTNDEIQFLDGETKGTYITGNTMVSQNLQIQDGFNLPKHTMETEGDITVIRFTG